MECGVIRITRDIRRGLCALGLALALGAGPSPGRAESLPPLRGEIAGAVKIADLPDLGLAWRATLADGGVALAATRPGADLLVELRPAGDDAGGWRWTILRGSLDLTELWPLAREKLGPAAEGWSASGRIELAGGGTWSDESGPVGEVRLALREGWARSDELDVELNGVEFDAITTELGTGTLPARQVLRVGKISAAGAELEGLRVVFGLDAGQVLEVVGGEVAFLGGVVRLRPFRMPLARPAVDAAADVEALRLDEAARLLPWLIQSAQGRLHGRVELAWNTEKGLRVRDGGLNVVDSEHAVLLLAPSPGLLTGSMEKKFRFFRGRGLRWMGIHNPAYAPLKEIEMGREGLRVESFTVDFWPDGPGVGRTAVIRIAGRPTGGKLVKEVKLDVNFHGPWSEFLAFGLNNELSGFSFRLE